MTQFFLFLLLTLSISSALLSFVLNLLIIYFLVRAFFLTGCCLVSPMWKALSRAGICVGVIVALKCLVPAFQTVAVLLVQWAMS